MFSFSKSCFSPCLCMIKQEKCGISLFLNSEQKTKTKNYPSLERGRMWFFSALPYFGIVSYGVTRVPGAHPEKEDSGGLWGGGESISMRWNL